MIIHCGNLSMGSVFMTSVLAIFRQTNDSACKFNSASKEKSWTIKGNGLKCEAHECMPR